MANPLHTCLRCVRIHWLLGVLLLAVCGFALLLDPRAALAQEEEEEPPPAVPAGPSGTATLSFEGRQVALPFTLGADGALFAFPPFAELLGLTTRVGPLGESLSVVFETKQIHVGSESPQMVITAEGEPQIIPLRASPIAGEGGLQVPYDFLDRLLGDELGLVLSWQPATLRFDLSRHQQREIQATITLVHQGRLTTVEIAFSARPRYRIERSQGAFEIRLTGDRVTGPVRGANERDALVRGIVVSPSRLRFELAEDAGVSEPRWLETPPRMILEIFPQAVVSERSGATSELRPPAPAAEGIRTIVIDPGHGGSETGAIGPTGTQEKEISLILAGAFKRALERRLPVRVVLTRDDDVDLGLDARAPIANQNKGDLFISLHLNASFGSRAQGAETYFLSREASDQRAAEAAAAENLVAAASGQPDDPESDLQLILWDLAQSFHLQESQRFATLVQEELNLTLGLRDRGVKQAPFRVLIGANMPAVLVELGFVSNPEEEAKLLSPDYRDALVDALVRAVVRFRAQVEGTSQVRSEGTP